jgi:putative ABC transport system permease protein
MKIKDIFTLSFTNLRYRKIRSWLTLIGIFIGIMAVVALVSLGQGMEDAINDQFAALGTDKITIQGAGSTYGPPGTGAVGKLTDHDVRIIEEVSGVSLVIPRYLKPMVVEFNDEKKLFYGASVPIGGEDIIQEVLGIDIIEGRMIRGNEGNNILVGAGIKYSDRELLVGQKVNINEEQFRIVGKLEKTGNPIIDNQILIGENIMVDVLQLPNEFSLIAIQIEEGKDIMEMSSIIERRLRTDRGQKIGEEDFIISTPQEALDSLNSILNSVKILIVGIAAISLLVGAIGITNTMYTAVLERRREIGIMKSIGATNNDVQSIFLFESGLLGLVGGIIGVVLGVLIAKSVEIGAEIAFGKSIIQASFDPWLIAGVLLFAFLVGTISGTLPAKKAAKLKPVDALKS